jgi:hypothetical protein
MDEQQSEVLRVLNNPKLTSGEKARLVAKLTGSAPHSAGAGMADIKRTSHHSGQSSKPGTNWKSF